MIIDNIEFNITEVKLPISKFKGSKHCYLGFDVSFFKNRYRDYDINIQNKKDNIIKFIQNNYKEVIIENDTIYIKEIDLTIDIRLDYIHNFNAYNKKNVFHINCLNELILNNEIDIIRTWCIIDPERRSNFIYKKYLEVFNYNDNNDLKTQINRVCNGIFRCYNDDELKKELNQIIKNPGNYNSSPSHNKIVTNFNKHIFKNENEYYLDCIKRRRHIENCRFLQYKEEYELTDNDILINFRFNKYVQYYSYFSVLWAKAFLTEYKNDIKSVLDIFGGWGHRYLAFLKTEYIYNDIWNLSFDGVKKVHEFCERNIHSLPKKTFLNEDAKNYNFKNLNYDCIFTCPPYFNVEVYDNGEYKDWNNFMELWDKSLENSITDKVKIFAFVIRDIFAEDLKKSLINYNFVFEKEIKLGKNIKHHYNRGKSKNSSSETLYIYFNKDYKKKEVFNYF
jgi:hypothetical protein